MDQFIKLAPEPEIDAKIATRQRVLDAVKEAGQIQARSLLAEIGVAQLPDGLDGLLEKTIDEIADGAEKQLTDHMVAHGMGADGQGWILHGMAHTNGDTGPFCGQDTKGLPLITAYRSVFSESYKGLKADVKAFRDYVAAQFGDAAIGRLTIMAAQNQRDAEYWRAYCDINTASVAMPTGFPEAVRALGQVVLELLDRKAQAPLERVLLDDRFKTALEQFRAVEATVGTVDDTTFHWQTQNATTPESSRGREIINHEKLGISLHLFVRDAKLEGGKAAPFVYEGPVRYQSHTGSAPMSVVLKLS